MEVVPYSVDTLKVLLKDKSGASEAYVNEKLQSRYFENYFDAVKAHTILVEPNYTDKDYIEDFAAYYVRCFGDYKKTCTRLHFFSGQWEKKDIEALLKGKRSKLSPEKLQAQYLGFIVIKPLPQTFLGRTCLITYDSDGGRRYYVGRPYDVHLFGLKLTVQSLAYQEQDTVAGACATSALWSIFQGTGKVFHHHIPSPVEVSNYADHAQASEARRSPSKGLTDEQAFRAIRQIGLEATDVTITDRDTLVRTAYAYLKGDVPLYLRADIWQNEGPFLGELVEANMTFLASHAMAVVGHSLGLPAGAEDKNNVRLTAYKMDKIYVHDDQVGPFARAELTQRNLATQSGTNVNLFSLLTSWPQDNVIYPTKLILPLYHKIRIPFSTAYSTIVAFDRAFKEVLVQNKVNTSDLEWDIYLTTGNREKEALRDSGTAEPKVLLEMLLRPMPRFLWKARIFWCGEPALTILMDATDIEQSQTVSAAWAEKDSVLAKILRVLAESPRIKALYEASAQWQIWKAMTRLR